MAVVCYTAGDYNLPELNVDDFTHVADAPRALMRKLIQADWSSDKALGKGLRRLAIAQLGTAGSLKESEFISKLTVMAISKLLPEILKSAAELQPEPHKVNLLAAANRCELARDLFSAVCACSAANSFAKDAHHASRAALRSAVLGKNTVDAPVYIADTAASVADMGTEALLIAATASNGAAANVADQVGAAVADIAKSAWFGLQPGYAVDKLLADFAEGVVQILIEMNSPGSKFLYLTE
jgi:hypothetical protein